jgi:hypothetical protein
MYLIVDVKVPATYSIKEIEQKKRHASVEISSANQHQTRQSIELTDLEISGHCHKVNMSMILLY